MKLIAFKIENFKSIVNTGWVTLSKDGISCLIGQNESGKSAVLEALNCFGSKTMQDDFIRNDMTSPGVHCRFELEKKQVDKILAQFSKADGYKELVSHFEKLKNVITVLVNNNGNNDNEFEYTGFDADLHKFLLAQKPVSKEMLEDATLTPQELLSLKERHSLTWAAFNSAWNKHRPAFILFNDEDNLLPNEISVKDLTNDSDVSGKQAVLNLLAVANIDIAKLETGNARAIKQYMSTSNKGITAQFQDFWTQRIGKGSRIEVEIELGNRDSKHAESGQQFLQFWIKDGEHTLHPKQRSKGVRWFISFYLSLKADSLKKKDSKSIFLIDEPGASLHARAQEDVIKVFEDIHKTNQIIYTTHSQHLIQFDNLYRLLAVQRRDDNDDDSDTFIIPAYHLGSASTNTLAPILEHMGINFSNQDVIARNNNIILEEVSALYYFQAFSILKDSKKYNYLPATGVSNVEQLALLFLGWGLGFSIIFDDDSAGRKAYQNIVKNVYIGNEDEAKKHIYRIKKCAGIEDVFDKSDFAKYIIKKPVEELDAEKSNSDIAKILKMSKPIAALDFFIAVKEGRITFGDLCADTQHNVDELFINLERVVSNQYS